MCGCSIEYAGTIECPNGPVMLFTIFAAASVYESPYNVAVVAVFVAYSFRCCRICAVLSLSTSYTHHGQLGLTTMMLFSVPQ